MRSRTVACSFAAVIVLVVGSVLSADSSPTLKSVGDGLICQCGCGQTVTGCNHYVCSSRTEMQASIQKEIDAGKGETTILQDFVLRYGVKVLSTPPATGFNRLVWILPGVGLVAGLIILILMARRWRRAPPEVRTALPSSADPSLLAAVEEEMRRSGIGEDQPSPVPADRSQRPAGD
jgi:cytochrome c-type biogenesis protein CcmH/NrfF